MVELLKQRNYDVTHFQPFIDYISYLESLGYKHISTEESNGCIEEQYEGENHNLEILTFKDKDKEWISICKYRNQLEGFEQIEFMIYSKKYKRFKGNQWYNRIIKYDAHFEDEEFTRMVCSGYTYQDDSLLSGWRKLRKFALEDLAKVIDNKNMNLSELTLWADEYISEFYEVIDLKGKEVKELILGY